MSTAESPELFPTGPGTPQRSGVRAFLDHPRGLFVLFGAEMWERLSFYGLRALLVLYLTNHLKYDRPDALRLYATYTGLVYLTPLIGGFLADRVLGQRKAVFIGGLLMALGHFTMAFEQYLYLALGLIILGNGFFKPNISTMVGQLYSPGDARRDSAYTFFYMGINTGGFLAPVVCGTLGERVGWHWGFGAAGVGMVLGLLNFGAFQRLLGNQGFPPGRDGVSARLDAYDAFHVLLVSIVGSALVYAAVAGIAPLAAQFPNYRTTAVLAYWLLLAGVLIAVTWAVAKPRTAEGSAGELEPVPGESAGPGFSSAEWQRIAVILVVAVFSVVFWMGFEQAGGTFTLFASEKTDRTLPAFMQTPKLHDFPASWYQTINPLLIVLLAPFPLVVWDALERGGVRVNSAAKMGLGLIILGLGFVVMDYADKTSTTAIKAGPQWLVIVYLFNSVGELCLSPIGLSLVNKLAPRRVASLMMAVWFLCTAIANYLAGTMEEFLKHDYPKLPLFTFLIYSSIIPGVILVCLSPVLRRMSHGRL